MELNIRKMIDQPPFPGKMEVHNRNTPNHPPSPDEKSIGERNRTVDTRKEQ